MLIMVSLRSVNSSEACSYPARNRGEHCRRTCQQQDIETKIRAFNIDSLWEGYLAFLPRLVRLQHGTIFMPKSYGYKKLQKLRCQIIFSSRLLSSAWMWYIWNSVSFRDLVLLRTKPDHFRAHENETVCGVEVQGECSRNHWLRHGWVLGFKVSSPASLGQQQSPQFWGLWWGFDVSWCKG